MVMVSCAKTDQLSIVKRNDNLNFIILFGNESKTLIHSENRQALMVLIGKGNFITAKEIIGFVKIQLNIISAFF